MNLEQLKIDRSERKKRRRRGWSPWIGRLVVVAILALGIFVFWKPITGFIDRFRLTEVEIARVSAPASAADAVRGKAANGYVVAARRAALSADTPGRIVEMRVTEGSVVKKGDIVARLYSDEQQAAVEIAEADLAVARDSAERAKAELVSIRSDLVRLGRQEESAKAGLVSAESLLALRKADLDRAKQLLADEVATQSELDDARAAFEVAEADRTAAQAAVRSAEAAVATGESRVRVAEVDIRMAAARIRVSEATLKRARATLDKTIVRAPFDGVVVLKDAEVGEVVSPNSLGGSSARGSVVTMVDFASLEVQANVPETSLGAVEVGAPAFIYLDAYRGRKYDGEVSRIWPTADRQKGTVEVRITFDEPDERLRPEMGVRVVFVEEGVEAAAETKVPEGVLVPAAAIVRDDGRSGVFVFDRDRVEFRDVSVGARVADRVAVTGRLAEGEQVVLDPPGSLGDGDRVRVKE